MGHDDQAREGGYTRELAGEIAGADAHLVGPIRSSVYLGYVCVCVFANVPLSLGSYLS